MESNMNWTTPWQHKHQATNLYNPLKATVVSSSQQQQTTNQCRSIEKFHLYTVPHSAENFHIQPPIPIDQKATLYNTYTYIKYFRFHNQLQTKIQTNWEYKKHLQRRRVQCIQEWGDGNKNSLWTTHSDLLEQTSGPWYSYSI